MENRQNASDEQQQQQKLLFELQEQQKEQFPALTWLFPPFSSSSSVETSKAVRKENLGLDEEAILLGDYGIFVLGIINI